MKLKKLLALILALAMVLSSMPLALAEDLVIEEPQDGNDRGAVHNPPTIVFTVNPEEEGVSGSYTVQNVKVKVEDEEEFVYVTDAEIASAEEAVSRTGYHFDQWNIDLSEAHAYPVDDIEDNRLVVYAQFEINEYNVTYTANLADYPLPDAEKVDYKGHPEADPDTDVDGYQFVGFYVGETKYDDLQDIEIIDNTEILLKWKIETYNVTFDYNGADKESIFNPPEEGDVVIVEGIEYGATIPANAYNAAPTKEGTEFVGWVPEGDYTLDGAVEGPETFTATWEDQVFTVSYEGYDYTEEIKWHKAPVGYEPPAIEGGVFLGWSYEEGGEEPVALADIEIEADIHFFPIWDLESYEVTFNLNGGDDDERFEPQEIEYNKTIEDPGEPVRFGYHFDHWEVDGEEFDITTPITGATVLVAIWEGNAYTLEIVLDGIAEDEEPTYDDEPIEGPVSTIEIYDEEHNAFDIGEIKAKGHTFDELYTYEYYDGDEVEPGEVQVGAQLELNEDMVLVPTDKENEYALFLTPVRTSDFYVVEFYADEEAELPVNIQNVVYPPEEGKDLKVVAPEGMAEGTISEGRYLEGWYNGETKWDFDDDVTGHMTLTANWLEMMDVTFTLRDGAFVQGEDGKRAIPKGKSFAQMQALQEELEPLAEMNFELPKAVREGYNSLTWLNGTAVFDEDTVVDSNLTLMDKWDQKTWTVTYNPNGGTLKDVAEEQVLNGNTVAPKTDPELAGSIFEGWFWTPKEAEEPVPFVFGQNGTPVEQDINLKAKWTVAKAKIGNTLYRTLDEAIAEAANGATIELLDNYELTEDIEIPEDVSFKFGTYKVTGNGEAQFKPGNNILTIISGTFDGVVFNGNFDLKGGTFLKSDFTDCGLETFGGKYDAETAREINDHQLLEADKILAVVTSDGYYTYVDKLWLVFDDIEIIEGMNFYPLTVGKGETPAHAILEAIAIGELDEDLITVPVAPEGTRFGGWFEEAEEFETPFDLTKAFTGDLEVVYPKWIDQVTVTFVVEDEGNPFVIDSGDTVDITGWDYEEIIAKANKERDPDELDEFECWEYADHTEYKTTDKFEADTVIFARMKAKVVFNFMDATKEPVLIQVTHGDKLVVYKDEIPEVPEGSDGWVEPTEEGVKALNISDIIDYDRTYCPLYAEKTNWDLIDYYPGKGFSYDAETGDVTFIGTADDPIVMSWSRYEEGINDGIFVGLMIEAPSDVKETDEYQIQFDNGAWKDIKPTGTEGAAVTWDGRTINNNLRIAVEQIMTLDQIKSAAKDQTPITFSVKFRKKGAEGPCAEFNVSFDPGNVKFYLPIPVEEHIEDEVFLIRDYRYEYTLSFDTTGGEPPEIEPITVEYGTEVPLPANPTKEFYQFDRWVGRNEWEGEEIEFYSGVWDVRTEEGLPSIEDPEGSGQYYGGYIDEEGVFHKNSIIMTDDVLLTAEWNEINAGVEINYNGHNSWDWESYVLTDPVSSVELPDVPDEEWEIFTGWDVYAGMSEGEEPHEIWVPFDYKEDEVIGDWAIPEINEWGDLQYKLRLSAHYEDFYTMTFETGEEEPLEVKAPKLYDEEEDPIPVEAAAFYTEDVAAVEAEIEGFQYWTLVAPDEEGAYEEAPEKFDFEDEENLVDEDLTVYPYTVSTEVTIKPALNLVDQIGILFDFTLPEGAEASDYKVNVAYDNEYQSIDKDYAFADLPIVDGQYELYALNTGSDEMSDEVTLTVYKGEEVVATETYSIASIADGWLNDGNHEALAAMLKTMLQYGHYAEIQFNHNANETAIPAGTRQLEAIPAEYGITDDPTTLADYIGNIKCALSLDAAVTLFVDIEPKEGYGLEDFQIKVTDEAGKEVAIADPTLVGGKIEVVVAGIYPDQMTSDYNIIVTVNGVSATFKRSVMNGAYTLEQEGKAVNVLEALYLFSDETNKFWGGNG